MIAFVIVAAALAFVVLNMGFSTTQRAKTAIISSLSEASSSIEIAGKVTGIGDVTGGFVNVTNVPIKVASGGDSVNMNPTLTAVKYLSNSVSYDDIFVGALGTGSYVNITLAMDAAMNTGGFINANTARDTAGSGNANSTAAFLYYAVNRNDNVIIDQGEHANIAIVFKSDERPSALDNLRIEVLVPTGAPLTIERQVPNVTNLVVDLG
ncbi:MAG: flagellin [Crenarchaeota archaeon]|nr:MAG: flagellin [Thermoproteota archaeon]RDJ34309.1 MAG: flagellin [Thermoproteota archaeon]RDJ37890.1 MAG: flagellin [Thermoproteota archaeon]RDJ39317.1 MAG: flagellin [Thermoproteota archaeon]